MRYHALASDYDGTLAHNGRVDEPTVASLKKLLATGRRLILVTGRELPELLGVFPEIELFEMVVAENGGLLYRPASKEETPLTDAPSEKFVQALTARGVGPISVGRTIVATWEPHQQSVLDTIREMGLELQVIFNKGAVMILPAGVNKASGLSAALKEMKLSPDNVVGVGDAENDHSFLKMCELSAAVSNALPAVKETADVVTTKDHGAGVSQLIDFMVTDDLRTYTGRTVRQERRRRNVEGELPPEKCFYFQGPAKALNLRAQNLTLFLQMADGIDDETWQHHLENGDFAKWFRNSLQDESLARAADKIASQPGLAPFETKQRLRAVVEQEYQIPAASTSA